jgi:hypothetical protein
LKELLDQAHVRWGSVAGSGQLEGRFFDPDKWVKTADPQCGTVTALQGLSGTGGVARCTLQALAKVVPGNTPGAVVTARDANGNPTQYGLIVLQNAQPGKQGNLGRNVLKDLPVFRWDGSLSKTFKLTESKTLAFRADVNNILNHPQPNAPSLTINSINSTTPWGQISGKGAQTRTVQGQLRLNF